MELGAALASRFACLFECAAEDATEMGTAYRLVFAAQELRGTTADAALLGFAYTLVFIAVPLSFRGHADTSHRQL